MVILHDANLGKGPKPFRFELYWLNNADLLPNMKLWWDSVEVSGTPGYVLKEKLKNLKAKVRVWAKENYRRYEHRLQRWESILQVIERKNLKNCQIWIGKKEEAKLKIDDALRDTEIFWSQRSNYCG